MGLRCVPSQGFTCPSLITAMPFTVGMWVKSLSISSTPAHYCWSIGDSASATDYYTFGRSNGTAAGTIVRNDGSSDTTTIATMVANVWLYILIRFAAATEMRAAIFVPGTGHTAGVDATSKVFPAGANTMAIGGRRIDTFGLGWEGDIAEFFIADDDVFTDAAANTPAELTRQIALRGPFSIPMFAPKVVQYHSLRQNPNVESKKDNYFRGERVDWTKVSTPIPCEHVPFLAAGFVRPDQGRRLLMI